MSVFRGRKEKQALLQIQVKINTNDTVNCFIFGAFCEFGTLVAKISRTQKF